MGYDLFTVSAAKNPGGVQGCPEIWFQITITGSVWISLFEKITNTECNTLTLLVAEYRNNMDSTTFTLCEDLWAVMVRGSKFVICSLGV